jgi:molybdopterin/thiamine biosynthesis adenylyltransferase
MLAREEIDLRLTDMGRVEESEMHRLALFYEDDITKFKVKQAKLRVSLINPNAEVKSFHEEVDKGNVFLLQGDVIIDATNKDETNKIVADHAVKKKVPLIIVRASGSSAIVIVSHKAIPAAQLKKLALAPVAKAGIFGPVTSLAASVVVAEVLKILLGEKENKMIELDAWSSSLKVTKL